MNPWNKEEVQEKLDTNLFDIPGKITGFHYDQMIVDDIINMEPLPDFHERNRVANRIWGIFRNRVKRQK